MRQAARQIVCCAVILAVFCVLCRLTVMREYSAYVPLFGEAGESRDASDFTFVPEEEGILRGGTPRILNGALRVPIETLGNGDTWFEIRYRSGETVNMGHLRVGALGTVYNESDGSFTGDSAVLIAVTLFFLLTGIIMLRRFLLCTGPDLYSYLAVYFSGFSIFSLATFLMLLRVTVSHMIAPWEYNMLTAYDAVNSASLMFMRITMPFVVVFALSITVSNVVLLRHMKPRLRNFLGMAIGILLLCGEALGLYLSSRSFSGPETEARIRSTLENVYGTAFVYFECVLAGAIICGLKAARREPERDADFIVILGCWIRRDGTLPPLLKGRADRALAFFEKQKAETGREAVLIPTGGQGADETTPEAEAIRAYLLERGVPDRLIVPECRAENTCQNMAYAAEIIRSIKPEGKTVFATSDYHVFRSGVWAMNAGLRAEGIGGRTVWWFWPNAFMRECLGLLQLRWKQEAAGLLILMVFFALLSMILK